jgi:hypothetical protein
MAIGLDGVRFQWKTGSIRQTTKMARLTRIRTLDGPQVSSMSHNDRLTDLEAHQVLADYQRSRIGLACRRDQLVDGRRRHVFAGEHDEMRERGEFRPRLSFGLQY